MKISNEQHDIINKLIQKNNVIVNAVAGSGKTTVLLFLAEIYKNKNILQITYNKQLKLEVREKAKKLNLKNIDIHTYHSLALRFYDDKCFTDEGIIDVIANKKNIKWSQQYDYIIIDEVQDMTPNYYELVCKFMGDLYYKNPILILGDSFQGVYDFKNADARYLLLAHKILNNNLSCCNLTLNESYRVSNQISLFINNVMLGHDRIISNKKSDHKVYYYKQNMYKIADVIYEKIDYLLKNGYNPDDIFVLSQSIKNNKPCKQLENLLVKNEIPVYFSRKDEDNLNNNVTFKKIVFTTFCQSKGRERKIVIIYGFDNTYFECYAKDKNPNICPSELYVAVTRASEILILIDHESSPPLKFLKKTYSEMKKCKFIEYVGEKQKICKTKAKKKNQHKSTVKDLTMYLSESIVGQMLPIIDILFKTEKIILAKNTTNIVSDVMMDNGLIEDVSDLNGIVIPAMYEQLNNKISTIEQFVNKKIDEQNDINCIYKSKSYSNDISKHLFIGNIYIALTEGILSKLYQTDNYDWLTAHNVDVCHLNLSSNIDKNIQYEKEIKYSYEHNMYGDIEINGRIDGYDDKTVWEFKCVSTLSLDHLLQLLIYAWMWEKTLVHSYGKKNYKIINIRTGEIKQLVYQDYFVDQIMELIFINNFELKIETNDEMFITKCKKIKKMYVKSIFDIFDD